MNDLSSFYDSELVRRRIHEYCGSASQIAGYGGRRRLSLPDGSPVPVPRNEINRLFAEGADVCRSVGDPAGNLLLLDVDYVNPEDPAEPYLYPETCFARMEPVYWEVLESFSRFGMPVLTLITGRGYHFVAFIRRHGAFHDALASTGRIGPTLEAKYRSRKLGDQDTLALGKAHEGTGRLLEFLAHLTIRNLRDRPDLPVTLADVPTDDGGPFICLDLSAYGDPIYERFSRSAFSGNQKAVQKRIARSSSPTVCVPRNRWTLSSCLAIRQDESAATHLASSFRAQIPEIPSEKGLHCLEDYRMSDLADFHCFFDQGWHDHPQRWSHTYDRFDTSSLPEAVRRPLEHPNPALLEPVHIRNVAAALWCHGWHPRSIAGLIRSKYERDFGWGDYWYRYDAATRADFYVRLVCGALADDVESGARFARQG
jgi:hypothetical protein